MRKTITLLIAFLALTVSSWATTTTITWNAGNGLTSIGLNEYTNLYWDESYHSYNDGAKTAMIEGVKVTISATVDGSDASFSTYENSTDLSVSNGATLTFSSGLYEIHSIVINHTESGYATGWTSGENTLTWTGNATHSVVLTDASVRNITSIVFTVEAIPTTTVTWDSENGLTDIYLSEYTNNCYNNNCNSYNDGPKTSTIDGVTATISATEDGSSANFDTYQGNTSLSVYNGGTITFSSASSQFLSIVVNFNSESGYVNSPSEWEFNASQRTVTWSGNATNSIVLESAYIENITSIVFTLEAEEEPEPVDPVNQDPVNQDPVTWDFANDAELAEIYLSQYTHYNFGGYYQEYFDDHYDATVKDFKGIVAAISAMIDGSYASFSTQNNYSIDLSGGGTLTFSTELGQFQSIVVNTNGGSGRSSGEWAWNLTEKTLTWAGTPANSVVLDNVFVDKITSIVFTFVPTTPAPTSGITWDVTDMATINVGKENGEAVQDVNLSQTVKNITVAAEAPASVGEAWNSSFMSGDVENGGSISVGSAGSLIFTAPEDHILRRIVITGNGCNSGYSLVGSAYLSEGWSYNDNTCTLTWSGEAASSVELACTNQENGMISFSLIESIVFTLDVAPDTREVPELKFLNGSDELTEATIVRDCHDDIFEPGTYYDPSTEYFLYVNNGVKYYQGQPFIDWAKPTEKGLTMTYSVPNNDVITLTKTSGNSFEFTVNGIGDAVVTASTEGNETYQPASITFTIHVEEGKAATKECVLKFIGGPNAGQFVPEDYKFEMVTGEEFPWSWFELREKYYTEAVYAPSFTIWGSRNYYVACLNGELKLRALTAGDDMFTIRYARCEGGDMNNEYRLIEFPVHIKPTEIALTTSVDFASDPSSNSAIANNATYDPTTQQVQIGQVISDEVVQGALTCYAFGHEGWDENLQNTISFELPQGNGSLTVNGTVQEGCVLKVKIRGEDGVHSFTPAQVASGQAIVNYNVPNQTAVVIYISTNGSSPAPRRAPAAKKDAPLAALTALSLTPMYPITANVDPDHAGVYYSTHYNEMQKYQLPAGTEAYVATVSGEDLNLTKVVNAGEVLPANTAVILKSTSASVVLTPTDAAAVTISATNDLHGVDSETAAPANCYVLSGHSTDNSVTGVGFYEFTGTIPAHKAYLTISGGAAYAPKKLRFVFNNEQQTTGIDNAAEALKSEKRIENGQLVIIKNGVRYNAQGQIVK